MITARSGAVNCQFSIALCAFWYQRSLSKPEVTERRTLNLRVSKASIATQACRNS